MVRVGLAAISGCTTASALYALVRIGQALLLDEPDPALVIWSEHAGYFWRILTAAYGGGMMGLLTWFVSARDPERTARVLARAVPVVAALLAVQAALLP